MFRKLALICGATLAMASAQAAAQDWYGALHVGKGWKNPAHVEHAVVTAALPGSLPWDEFDGDYDAAMDYDSGWGGGAAVGRAFGNWRLEGELGYRASKIGGFEVQDLTIVLKPTSIPAPPELTESLVTATLAVLNNEDHVRITGRAELLTGTLNLYYDLPVDWAVRPYIGAGLGLVRANKEKNVRLVGPFAHCAPGVASCVLQASVRSTEWDANWHAMAGVKYAINERWEAALGWRYTDLRGVTFELSDDVDDQGNPRFLGGNPLMVRKDGIHNLELTLMRRF